MLAGLCGRAVHTATTQCTHQQFAPPKKAPHMRARRAASSFVTTQRRSSFPSSPPFSFKEELRTRCPLCVTNLKQQVQQQSLDTTESKMADREEAVYMAKLAEQVRF